MPVIAVTYRLPDAGLTLLRAKGYTLRMHTKERLITTDELKKLVRGADALLCMLTEHIDSSVFDAAGKQLKIVANYAVGFDNIDVSAAAKRGIVVTNAPAKEVSESVAEHTVALVLALAHRIAEGDRFVRSEKYEGWHPNLLLGQDLVGKTVGIIGAGHIGQSVARRLQGGFGMKVVYTSPHRDAAFEKMFAAKYLSLQSLLIRSDVVTVHVPLTKETRHLISTKQLSIMKKTAYLINTARGPVVDEKALLRALAKKQIAGAGLDVYECEPAIDCDIHDHLALKNMLNVILTPHTASATIEARNAMSIFAAKNIIAVLSGKKPLSPVSS